jgi:hypothetical protein
MTVLRRRKLMKILGIIGVLILIAGAVLWCGNVFGFFPTFPGAGYIGLILGGFLAKTGFSSDGE